MKHVPSFDLRLENDPRFLKKVAEARASYRAGGGTAWEKIKEEDDRRSRT